ncbi:uncharacterized protein LOC128172185 isoform X2 [Crassostrea angulata]|uniref:Uncharacterized protein n=1 Tax=Magallana gigas TaxID=29159 RepID=A0A8W8P456_MAGGI|nr:uncharacterized protein LOC105326720 isoform X2 [Crassostrea gigas]XP_052693929.1 uncharacterized protein LOC128172185 isoform X2 [Crassostrea angulata]
MGVLVRLLILSTVAAMASSIVLRVMPRSQSRRIYSQRTRPQFSFGSLSSNTVNFGGSSFGLRNSMGSSGGSGYIMLGGDSPDTYNPFDLGDAPDIYPMIGGSSFGSRGSGLGGYPMHMFDPDNTYVFA